MNDNLMWIVCLHHQLMSCSTKTDTCTHVPSLDERTYIALAHALPLTQHLRVSILPFEILCKDGRDASLENAPTFSLRVRVMLARTPTRMCNIQHTCRSRSCARMRREASLVLMASHAQRVWASLSSGLLSFSCCLS